MPDLACAVPVASYGARPNEGGEGEGGAGGVATLPMEARGRPLAICGGTLHLCAFAALDRKQYDAPGVVRSPVSQVLR